MKKMIKQVGLPILVVSLLSSCHKIDLPVTSELTPDVFPKDSSQFVQTTGPAYVALRGNWATEYFFQQSESTDEMILPAYGGNWFDGAQNQQMHYHSWNRDNGYVNGNWAWLTTIVGTCNQAISILTANMPEGATKRMYLAEMKMVRALTYFMLMDNYGNVPIVTTYGDFSPKPNTPRAQVFSFIESEINAALPDLSTVNDITTYGRPTKWMAYALLAKMYLNAQYYTGAAKWNECIAACDAVINSGKFSLASMANYLVMFYPTNGPTSPGSKEEFIFAIPFDATASGFLGRSANYKARYDVPRSMGKVAAGAGYNYFNIPYVPGGPAATLPEFYANFNDPNDVRNKQWLTGPQFQRDGVTPITITTTNLGYDQFYTGPNPNASYTFQLNLRPNITLRQSVASFDVGNDEIAWTTGYRNIKFYPDATSTSRNQNNDIPVFRYSDIILMKAEAILRGGTATLGQSALSLVNMLRAQRSTSAPWAAVTLDDIYAERGREFAWEGWRRNDMIRYGKYEGSWGFKTNADTYRRIFPIPTNAFAVNSALVQNPGY
ncbi:RagB/SusD family nutrient uptake outer membrane protein [Flavisolibacter ginsenosidimutans]|uniref:RagB/SusD family nutrient uptake outer membrane protein n=1 Tax=Flavisolibacter ginsenosidimutans TaxID=661481 RepID=A0A5B8UHE1_9BACT|nr:RagB/SusD family nutrient uptake outer membrane protein [Flavisolibacter ginsenosidimutans]QEC55549.1 RagB/SusD family nutrient uptake outer membrane protein [Flavisolibacter ginsenosidimutans]